MYEQAHCRLACIVSVHHHHLDQCIKTRISNLIFIKIDNETISIEKAGAKKIN